MADLRLLVAQPPTDITMSKDWQWFFIVSSLAAIALIGVHAVRTAVRHRDVLPLVFLPAGFMTVPLEAMVCDMGKCWHAPDGQLNFYNAFGQSIPWHMPLLYAVYYGMFYLLCYSKVMQGKLTARYLWTLYGAWVAGTYSLVILVRQNDIWTQYGHQPLWIWKGSHPPFWTLLDVSSVVVPAGLIIVLHHLVHGWWRTLIVVASPVGAVMGHVGPGMPYYWVANSQHWDDDLWVHTSGAISMAMSVALVWITIRLLTRVRLEALGVPASRGLSVAPTDPTAVGSQPAERGRTP